MTPQQLKEWRKDMKLTQPQAAELVKVSLRTWKYWEAGEKSPPGMLEILLKLLSKP